MKKHPRFVFAIVLLSALVLTLILASRRLRADSGMCGGQNVSLPFTDVMGNPFFCQIAAAYLSGLTNGTSPTTYSPSAPVPREQVAAFVTRTQDSALRRGSLRAALNQWAVPTSIPESATTSVGSNPLGVSSDGADLWVTSLESNTVSRVRASDGKLLDTWTGAERAFGVIAVRGRIFVTGQTGPGQLYVINPRQPAGAVSVISRSLLVNPTGITTDGTFLWIATGQGVCRINPDTGDLTSFATDLLHRGILYDGANIWVTDFLQGRLLRLNSDGSIAQTVSVAGSPNFPVFDGTNIWVPHSDASNSVTVVRASTGTVVATLTGNGLHLPFAAGFDGQRILVTNQQSQGISLFRATDLTPLGSFPIDGGAEAVCSDGINFWITLSGAAKLARF